MQNLRIKINSKVIEQKIKQSVEESNKKSSSKYSYYRDKPLFRDIRWHKKIEGSKMSLIAYLIAHGASIPHYCYHNDLAIVGNCRICIVELETSIKPVISCTSDAVVGSSLKDNKVFIDSPLVLTARESVLEFLLLNHPIDCPICDQGGDCDLQDQSLWYGMFNRRFYKFKREVTDKNLGLVVKTVMTRCIHCTRCVRFTSDISGIEELGMLGRGGNSEIGTYVENVLASELSGNVIDLCPVGALACFNISVSNQRVYYYI